MKLTRFQYECMEDLFHGRGYTRSKSEHKIIHRARDATARGIPVFEHLHKYCKTSVPSCGKCVSIKKHAGIANKRRERVLDEIHD